MSLIATARSIFSLLFALLLFSCSPPVEPPQELASGLCLMRGDSATPSDIARMSRSGEIFGGCFDREQTHLYYFGQCGGDPKSTEEAAQAHLKRCSAVVTQSGASVSQSFTLGGDAAREYGLELYNLAAVGALPIAYIESYNNIVCVEAETDEFVSVAKSFGLNTSSSQWDRHDGPCSVKAALLTDGTWPQRIEPND